ncbi:MAG: hypothetical protein FWE27_07670 [Defluviitaleaceae bacterium]|nr:hypothetical protein [Defluviitaleaceae bacterium]
MKIDHLVINVDEKYQTDMSTIDSIRNIGFPYEPKWGKGTSGFKASNIWIGDGYFEMIRILKANGGGWREDWVKKYNNNHRGLICLFIDTDTIVEEFERLSNLGVSISKPEYLKFKWCLGLLTRTMPWQNSYLPFFEGVPFQLGFQQMKDEASKNWMQQYMIPNSKENGIDRIVTLNLCGNYTENDKARICKVFPNAIMDADKLSVELPSGQKLAFIQSETHSVEVLAQCTDEKQKGKRMNIHNISIISV